MSAAGKSIQISPAEQPEQPLTVEERLKMFLVYRFDGMAEAKLARAIEILRPGSPEAFLIGRLQVAVRCSILAVRIAKTSNTIALRLGACRKPFL